MKKMLLISTALMFATLATVRADEPSCQDFSDNTWCSSHGYKDDNCTEGYVSINCPFDTSKKFCHENQIKDCAVGDILWDDNKCYVLEIGDVKLDDNGMLSENGNTVSGVIINTPANKYPIGVVFDDVNKLAVGLDNYGLGLWQSNSDTYLQYFGSDNNRKHLFFGEQSVDNRNAKYDGCNNAQAYDGAAAYCSVAGCSAGDDHVAYDNNEGSTYLSCDISRQITFCRRTKGCNIVGMSTISGVSVVASGVDPTLSGSTVSIGNLPYNYISSSSQTGGWHDTVRLHAGTLIDRKQFNAPAAMTCYDLNDFGSCPTGSACANNTGGAVGAGHVWFLPSVGDLIKLANNYDAVRSNLSAKYIRNVTRGDTSRYILDVANNGAGMILDSKYWSSSQAESGGFYSYAYAVSQSLNQGTNCVANTSQADAPVKLGRNESKRIVCVYHYGDDWDMSGYSDLWQAQQQQDEPSYQSTNFD